MTATASEWMSNADSPGENDLVQRVGHGDHSAFRELVHTHQTQMHSVIFSILRHREDADDVAQQVFLKVYLSIDRFDGRGSLAGWIYRIAINECYDFLRRRNSRLRRESAPGVQETIPAERRPADRRLVDRDFLNKLLAHLPQQDRLLLVLKEIEGRSLNELAEMTGLKEGTIKIRLFRARRRLVQIASEIGAGPRVRCHAAAM